MTQRNMILIADHEEEDRRLLRGIFQEQYRIIEASDGVQAVELLERHNKEMILVFLGMFIPDKSGLDVLAFMAAKGYLERIPVIMVTNWSDADTDEKAYGLRAADIIYKPFEPKVVMRRTMNIIELYTNRRDMEHQLKERTKELWASKEKLKKSNAFLIRALSSVVEIRSLESGEHIQRIQFLTKLVLKYLRRYYPQYQITEEQAGLIVDSSALHDLGKVALSDSIMLKNGELTKEEMGEMKKHTIYGCELLEKFKQEETDFYRYCYDICRSHHERFDGSGYPDGLAGDAIPIWAQVVGVVDVLDTLVKKLVYQGVYGAHEAFRKIYSGDYGEFSPAVLECLRLAKYDFINALQYKLSFADSEVEEQGFFSK